MTFFGYPKGILKIFKRFFSLEQKRKCKTLATIQLYKFLNNIALSNHK